MKRLELFCATAMAALVANPAYAQEASPPPAEEAAEADPDEIFVTATLRSENLQAIPIAVSAYNAEALDKSGVKDLKNLDQVSASFNANSSQTESGGTTLRVRGVGTTGNNSGLESAVGIFLDGVYLSRPGVALGDLLDVQQVELLRGPQGTLFGRNTSAGAVSIKTAKPNLNAFEGYANATYGNFDLFNAQAGFSAPIIEGVFGVRFSGATRNRDGFLRNAAGGESNDRDRYLFRGQAYFEPSADFSLRIIADYSHSDEKCCDAVILQDTSYVTNGFYALSGLPANGGVTNFGNQAFQKRRTSNNREFRDQIEQYGISGQIEWDLGGPELTYIVGYRNFKAQSSQESDFVSVNVFSTSDNTSASTANSINSVGRLKTFTNELRFTGNALSDKLQYLFGGYYSDERIREQGSLTLGPDYQAYVSAALTSLGAPGPNPALNIFASGVSAAGNFAANRFTQNARNYSVFTNNTFNLTDQFAINLGARYSDDRKRGTFTQLAANSPACTAVLANPLSGPLAALQPLKPLAVALTCFPFSTQANYPGAGTPALPTPFPFNQVFKDNELIYTGKLTFKPAENVNTYASFTHGYKSGGFNLDPTAAAGGASPQFKSEKVDAYEAGIKTKFADGKITANLAIFHQDLKDFQVLEFTGVQFVTFNVPKAKSSGVELETLFRPTRDLSFNLSGTYTDARYPKNCASGLPLTTAFQTVRTLCGAQLTNAPKFVGIAGFDFSQEIGNNLEFGLNGSLRYETKRRTSTQDVLVLAAGSGSPDPKSVAGGTAPNPFDIQKGTAKVNMRAGFGAQDGRWRVEVFGDNIFDVQTRNVTFNVPLRGVGSLPGPFSGASAVSRGAFLQDPRTYGVTVRTKF